MDNEEFLKCSFCNKIPEEVMVASFNKENTDGY